VYTKTRLKYMPAVAPLLGQRVRILLRAQMFVTFVCCVFVFCVGNDFCDGLITRSELCVCVCV
jgi:hypothetical protein